MTIVLPAVVRAWPGTDFSQVLKDEIESLGPGVLPLQQCTNQGGNIDDSDIAVSVLTCGETGDTITAKLGVFFTEVVGGCNCDDDPVRENGYCEIRISIDTQTAIARFSPLSQDNHSQI